MKYVFRSIAAGLLVGSALFFVPFGFPLLLLIVLFFVISSRRRRFRRMTACGDGSGFGFDGPLPIDGFGNRPHFNRNEPKQSITVQ